MDAAATREMERDSISYIDAALREPETPRMFLRVLEGNMQPTPRPPVDLPVFPQAKYLEKRVAKENKPKFPPHFNQDAVPRIEYVQDASLIMHYGQPYSSQKAKEHYIAFLKIFKAVKLTVENMDLVVNENGTGPEAARPEITSASLQYKYGPLAHCWVALQEVYETTDGRYWGGKKHEPFRQTCKVLKNTFEKSEAGNRNVKGSMRYTKLASFMACLLEVAGSGDDPKLWKLRTVGVMEFLYERIIMHPGMTWREGGRGALNVWKELQNLVPEEHRTVTLPTNLLKDRPGYSEKNTTKRDEAFKVHVRNQFETCFTVAKEVMQGFVPSGLMENYFQNKYASLQAIAVGKTWIQVPFEEAPIHTFQSLFGGKHMPERVRERVMANWCWDPNSHAGFMDADGNWKPVVPNKKVELARGVLEMARRKGKHIDDSILPIEEDDLFVPVQNNFVAPVVQDNCAVYAVQDNGGNIAPLFSRLSVAESIDLPPAHQTGSDAGAPSGRGPGQASHVSFGDGTVGQASYGGGTTPPTGAAEADRNDSLSSGQSIGSNLERAPPDPLSRDIPPFLIGAYGLSADVDNVSDLLTAFIDDMQREFHEYLQAVSDPDTTPFDDLAFVNCANAFLFEMGDAIERVSGDYGKQLELGAGLCRAICSNSHFCLIDEECAAKWQRTAAFLEAMEGNSEGNGEDASESLGAIQYEARQSAAPPENHAAEMPHDHCQERQRVVSGQAQSIPNQSYLDHSVMRDWVPATSSRPRANYVEKTFGDKAAFGYANSNGRLFEEVRKRHSEALQQDRAWQSYEFDPDCNTEPIPQGRAPFVEPDDNGGFGKIHRGLITIQPTRKAFYSFLHWCHRHRPDPSIPALDPFMRAFLASRRANVPFAPEPSTAAQEILAGVYFYADDFEVLDSLGGGTYGQVFKARVKTERDGQHNVGDLVAIKLETFTAKQLMMFMRTLVDGNAVRDRGIAESFAFFVYDAKYDGSIHSMGSYITIALVQELGAYTLADRIPIIHLRRDQYMKQTNTEGLKLELKKIWEFAVALMGVVNAMNTNGVVHRDIKPANIVYSTEDERYKLVDFGLVRALAVSRTRRLLSTGRQDYLTEIGTAAFMPNSLGDNRFRMSVNHDVFAVVMTVMQMLWTDDFRNIDELRKSEGVHLRTTLRAKWGAHDVIDPLANALTALKTPKEGAEFWSIDSAEAWRRLSELERHF